MTFNSIHIRNGHIRSFDRGVAADDLRSFVNQDTAFTALREVTIERLHIADVEFGITTLGPGARIEGVVMQAESIGITCTEGAVSGYTIS